VPDYYADSRALIKCYVNEVGSAWMRSMAESDDHVIITARISFVEVFSALNRRLREAKLNPKDYRALAGDVAASFANDYQVIELTTGITEGARRLLESHALRAYDAVQLASALYANEAVQSADLSSLVFLSTDERLTTAARAEGLTAENPNEH
jgi:predicted nucleic acid-binding protein